MDFELIFHARVSITDRQIELEWIARVIRHPELVLPDLKDDEVELRFGRVPEFGNRVLRVAVNSTVWPVRVVTVYFDRNQKNKL